MGNRGVTEDWLKAANRIPFARAMAIGAISFLVAHGIPQQEFDSAEQRGDTVSTVFTALDRVGQNVGSDRIAGLKEDQQVVSFWQNEIKRAAGHKPAGMA